MIPQTTVVPFCLLVFQHFDFYKHNKIRFISEAKSFRFHSNFDKNESLI